MIRFPTIYRLTSANSIIRRGLLLQPPVAHLEVPKLLLDHPERVFHLGPNAGLQALDLLQQIVKFSVWIERLALARVHAAFHTC